MRTLLAFLLAPLVIAFGWSTYTFFWADSASQPFSKLVPELLVTVLVVYIGAAWVTALIALPLFLLLRRFGLVRCWTAGATGAVIGGTIGAFMGNLASPQSAVWLGALGGVAGLVFWLVGGFNAQRGETYVQTR